MTGNLQDRPFLLLLLRVVRVMLGICAGAMAVVGGAIVYSITSVQDRGLSSLTGPETAGLSILALLLLASIILIAGATGILRQNQSR